MRLKYVPRGSWQPNVHNMNRKRATQGRTEPQLRYHVQRCAMMCHALQSQVPPVCRSGYLLVVFGEVSEKSQNLRWCRPWHGLDTALMSCELVLKRWNKKNPRITSIVPGFGAHTCRLVTEKRSESVWIFDDFCTASIALNHWTFGLPFGLPLDYISESSCAHFVKQNDENSGHHGTPKGTDEDFRYLLTGKPLDQSEAFVLVLFQLLDTSWYHFCVCFPNAKRSKSTWDNRIPYDAMMVSREVYIIARHQFISQAELLLLSLLHCQRWIFGMLSSLTFHKTFDRW
jgi:hypothetical protein